MKILIAMSGGVDSSVSAFLLKQRGYEVTGLTMFFGDEKSRQTVEEAREICLRLKIEHIIYDCSEKLENYVVNNFIREYLSGKTPNPCIVCNKYLKFGVMLKYSRDNGYDFLASGHYAKIIFRNSLPFLAIPRDRQKDQTYFLYRVFPGLFRYVIFPLSNYTKDEVKKIAAENNLILSNRESYSACFLPDNSLQKFWQNRGIDIVPGSIQDMQGKIIGTHKGAVNYTVGQRSGLNIKKSVPLYVVSTDIRKNLITVGGREDLKTLEVTASDAVFWKLPEKGKYQEAKIRHSHQKQKCRVYLQKDKIIVKFEKFVETVSPGQSIVFYEKSCLTGGAIMHATAKKSRF